MCNNYHNPWAFSIRQWLWCCLKCVEMLTVCFSRCGSMFSKATVYMYGSLFRKSILALDSRFTEAGKSSFSVWENRFIGVGFGGTVSYTEPEKLCKRQGYYCQKRNKLWTLLSLQSKISVPPWVNWPTEDFTRAEFALFSFPSKPASPFERMCSLLRVFTLVEAVTSVTQLSRSTSLCHARSSAKPSALCHTLFAVLRRQGSLMEAVTSMSHNYRGLHLYVTPSSRWKLDGIQVSFLLQ